MESLKRGAELAGEARDWYVLKLAELVTVHGMQAVGAAIDRCLEDSPFRPDISEVRGALGVTSAQREKATADDDQRQAVAAWKELLDYIGKWAGEKNGKWCFLESRTVNIKDENGKDILIFHERGWPIGVKSKEVPAPPLHPRLRCCLQSIGDLGRIKNCDEKYMEVARKEFLKAWPLSKVEAESMMGALPAGEDFVGKLMQEATRARAK